MPHVLSLSAHMGTVTKSGLTTQADIVPTFPPPIALFTGVRELSTYILLSGLDSILRVGYCLPNMNEEHKGNTMKTTLDGKCLICDKPAMLVLCDVCETEHERKQDEAGDQAECDTHPTMF